MPDYWLITLANPVAAYGLGAVALATIALLIAAGTALGYWTGKRTGRRLEIERRLRDAIRPPAQTEPIPMMRLVAVPDIDDEGEGAA